jgi:hypothetical protein
MQITDHSLPPLAELQCGTREDSKCCGAENYHYGTTVPWWEPVVCVSVDIYNLSSNISCSVTIPMYCLGLSEPFSLTILIPSNLFSNLSGMLMYFTLLRKIRRLTRPPCHFVNKVTNLYKPWYEHYANTLLPTVRQNSWTGQVGRTLTSFKTRTEHNVWKWITEKYAFFYNNYLSNIKQMAARKLSLVFGLTVTINEPYKLVIWNFTWR